MSRGGAININSPNVRNSVGNLASLTGVDEIDKAVEYAPLGGLDVDLLIDRAETTVELPTNGNINASPTIDYKLEPTQSNVYYDLANSWFQFEFNITHTNGTLGYNLFADANQAGHYAMYPTAGFGLFRDIRITSSSVRISDDLNDSAYFVELIKHALTKSGEWISGSSVPLDVDFQVNGPPAVSSGIGEGASNGGWNISQAPNLRQGFGNGNVPNDITDLATNREVEDQLAPAALVGTALQNGFYSRHPEIYFRARKIARSNKVGTALADVINVQMMWQPPCAVWSQYRYWSGIARLDIHLDKNPASFCLTTCGTGTTTAVNTPTITYSGQGGAKLLLRRVYVNEATQVQVNNMFAQGAVYQYPIVRARVDFRQLETSQSQTINQVLVGQKCDIISMVIVPSAVLTGDPNRSNATDCIPTSQLAPYSQVNSGNVVIPSMTNFQLRVDGHHFPLTQLENEIDMKRAYYELYAQHNLAYSQGLSPMLSYDAWRGSCQILNFSLRRDGGMIGDNVLYNEDVNAQQNVVMKWQFTESPTATIPLVAMFVGWCNNLCTIDSAGAVSVDF